MIIKAISEKEFLRTVAELATITGWQFYHPLPSASRRGKWATWQMGSVGFPDMTLVRGERLIFAELKVRNNKLTEEQKSWLEKLKAVKQVEVHVWRPEQWNEIVEILKL